MQLLILSLDCAVPFWSVHTGWCLYTGKSSNPHDENRKKDEEDDEERGDQTGREEDGALCLNTDWFL